MRVLIVNTSERTGGAAVAASRLAEALMNNGIKAKLLVRDKQSRAPHVVSAGGGLRGKWCFLYERVVIWLNNLFSRRHLFAVSIANTGTDITLLPEFQEADVVHLHWVNQGFLSRSAIGKVLSSGKPVVWTMHDMWPLTAICHHAYECDGYRRSCGRCPFLRFPGDNDLSARVFRRKQRLLDAAAGRPVAFVAVSEWLAGKARESALTGTFPVHVIPNAISLSHFTRIDRTDARTALGVSERVVLSFGAARIDDPIKGFHYLADALRLLVDSGRLQRSDVRVLLFGGVRDGGVLSQLPVPYTHLGYIDDEDRLSLIYSASDATVSSSLYETFGQTLIEAMACGSVPVSFAGSGQADIISHRQNGYLADRLSVESLADGIMWAVSSGLKPQDQRRSVSRRYAESVVARRYTDLYQQLLNENH